MTCKNNSGSQSTIPIRSGGIPRIKTQPITHDTNQDKVYCP